MLDRHACLMIISDYLTILNDVCVHADAFVKWTVKACWTILNA